jgi:hypothetical protein
VFCGVVIALMRDPGTGTLQGLRPYLPPQLSYGTTMRMVRAGQWAAQAVLTDLAAATLRSLPPPAEGVRYLIGARTRKPQRGQQHPVGPCTRHGQQEP